MQKINLFNFIYSQQLFPSVKIQIPMETFIQLTPSFQSQSIATLHPQPTANSQQMHTQTQSEQTTSPVGSNTKSEKSLEDGSSQNSTQPDLQMGYMSLRSIKSKEEIELESKENQQILTNLNFNIDDLFRKITSLTDEITTELQPKLIKQRSSPNKIQSLSQLPSHNQQPISTEPTKLKQQCKSTSQISFKTLFPQMQQLQKIKSSYKPIFFQSYRPVTQQHSINMKLFQTGKSLGCGKFGEVVQCRNIKTGALYALKKIFKSVIDEYQMEDQLLTELKILKQIDHPNIVRAYESFTDDFHIFILMEYIHGPLLVKKLKCSQTQCKHIIKQVLQALKYLHENKITHRDIKPENIILTGDNVVKICDFGWASQGQDKMNILCGTLDYVSPQMVKQSQYSEKSDLWNLGVLAYELIHGYAPFRGSSKSRIFEKVRNLEYTFSEEIEISEQCRSFISGYLKEEHERESIQWGLNHEFMKVKEQETKHQQKRDDRDQSTEDSLDIELLREMEQLMQE